MKKQLYAFVAVALSLATLCGCSGKPKGFPSVKPCKIVVTNGSTPIADVEVALIPADPISGTIIGGRTDETGTCVVRTTFANFSAPGSPSGEFTVTLKKDPIPEDMPVLSIEEMKDMSRAEVDEYERERQKVIAGMEKIIPPPLTSFQTSPIKIKVPDEAEKAIDVTQL